MKKMMYFAFLAVFLLVLGNIGTVRAEIIPPYGYGQFGLQAVVLCESLTIRQNPSTSSKAVQTVPYGTLFATMNESGGFVDCLLSDDVDAEVSGWVNSEYIIIDPAWYRTERNTPVYAWNSEESPKVALLAKDTRLPILKEEGDWLIVSLRGATGWIRKSETDKAPAAIQ